MKPFKQRQENPDPYLLYWEVELPKGINDMSEGTYECKIKAGELNKNPALGCGYYTPYYQVMINLNPHFTPPQAVIILGKTTNIKITHDKEIVSFEMPKNLDHSKNHIIKTFWENNSVMSLTIDGKPLKLYLPRAAQS